MAYVPLPQVQYAELKQERLTKMKRIATGLLVAVTIIFLAAHFAEKTYPYTWIAIVKATAEAAMVGALADWFAVTALFRHPLGLPIPHTAIIPTRKERIGRTLGGFVQNNFLSRELIGSKMRELSVSRRIAEWLSKPENARTMTRHGASTLAGAVEVLKDEDVQELLDKSVMERIRSTRVAPIVGNILSLVTAQNRHQEILDEALKMLDRIVHEHDEVIRERIRQESPWWIPDRVDDKIHDKVVTAIENTLRQISADPEHPLRIRFDTAVHDFVERLRTSPDVIQKGEELKADLLSHPAVREFSSEVWKDTKASIVRYATRTDDAGLKPIERGIVSFGNAMMNDPVMLEKIDAWLLDGATKIVEQYRSEVGTFIAETVARWDPDETSRKIELAVGRDLQFVRINGTIMGGIVGLLLYLVTRL